MIKGFRHKGLERFFLKGSKSGISPRHADKLRIQLTALEHAIGPKDMDAPVWDLHRLRGDLAGFYAVSISGNWRLIFRFEGANAKDVDYLDYH